MILLIKKHRLNKGITVRDLALLVNCSHSYLTELENNKKRNPNLDIIENIGHVFNICPIRLFGGCYGHICTSGCYYYSEKYLH